MLSLPKQIPIQSLLYKMTTCLTRSANTFFCLPNEKNLSETTTTKLYPAKKWEINVRQQWIKNKCLSDYIYSRTSYFIMQSLFNVYEKRTIYKIIENYLKSYNIICFFLLYMQQRHFLNVVEHLWCFFFFLKLTAKSC